ncbi:hypothetical protein ACF08N_04975 [Streptomyces sp. NPDC015127]|uniref:hypothetical protein n=1 Tax=Streptomyces sp. NPDC015127 TaxID=3364939 RepID=UPI0036FEF8B0
MRSGSSARLPGGLGGVEARRDAVEVLANRLEELHPAEDRDVPQVDVAHQELRRFVESPIGCEQFAELDLAVEVAALFPAAPEPFGGLGIAVLLEQYAESVGASGMPVGHGAVERLRRLPVAPDLPVPGKGVVREGVPRGHRLLPVRDSFVHVMAEHAEVGVPAGSLRVTGARGGDQRLSAGLYVLRHEPHRARWGQVPASWRPLSARPGPAGEGRQDAP